MGVKNKFKRLLRRTYFYKDESTRPSATTNSIQLSSDDPAPRKSWNYEDIEYLEAKFGHQNPMKNENQQQTPNDTTGAEDLTVITRRNLQSQSSLRPE